MPRPVTAPSPGGRPRLSTLGPAPHPAALLVAATVAMAMALGTVLSACSAGASVPAPPASQGVVLNRPTPQSVVLEDQSGKAVSLAGLRGKDVVLAPFLSLCQDECPLVTGAFIALERDLRAAHLARQVVFVEATVDPGRDSVARLAAYRKDFGADWELWTGTPAQIAAFWKPFGVTYQIVPEEQPAHDDWLTGQPLTYDVVHTDGYILIDTKGRERFVDASAPNLRGKLDKKLTSLLDSGGVYGLDHPQATDWTLADALRALSWLLGTEVHQAP
ncbi:MAG TPA: SCO family protein [Acidimicrobiales bacterium]|nr:SCO family protein [Acidimicrobiales bacterium]